MNYSEYLSLDKLLDCQRGCANFRDFYGHTLHHDELMFIIVHQVYELQFKLILHELKSCILMFSSAAVSNEEQLTNSKQNTLKSNSHYLSDQDLLQIVLRLQRVVRIQQIMNDQFHILETLSPSDFLDFREHLGTASGMQSQQFRMLEIILGSKSFTKKKKNFGEDVEIIEESKEEFCSFNSNNNQRKVMTAMDLKLLDCEQEKHRSLFDCVEEQLERLPFVNCYEPQKSINFYDEYHKAVQNMFTTKLINIENDLSINSFEKEQKIFENVTQPLNRFNILFDFNEHKLQSKQKHVRFSMKALRAALFILIYRQQPLLQMPYQLLVVLQDIDQNFALQRQKHANIVLRMIGHKAGTGGSSGYDYLNSTIERNRIFTDFNTLSSFILPKSYLPTLPSSIFEKLQFVSNNSK